MKEKRYMNDFINETRWDEETGKETRVPVYRGVWYRTAEAQQTLLAWAAGPCAVYWVLIILYFYLNFPGATILYVFLPAACGLFPALYWALGAWCVGRAPKQMTRVHKEKGMARVLRSSAGCAVFAAAAAMSDGVQMAARGVIRQEAPGFALLLCACLCAYVTAGRFRRWCRELEEEKST